MKVGALALAAAASSASAHKLRGSLPTTNSVTLADLKDLQTKLSTFAQPRLVDQDAWLRECAYYILKPKYNGDQAEPHVSGPWVMTDYFFIDQQHGHCAMKMESAFGMEWNYTLYDIFYQVFEGVEPGSEEWMALGMSAVRDSLPEMTLPGQIAFPQTARDVVEVIKFAGDHSLQVSVKNTGHNYIGQSDVKDSFQLNMRNYPKYSGTDISLCSTDTASEPLEGPPCKLALARGKDAIVRVSGSEGNDSINKAVRDWNHAMPREKRFQVSGGGEGAVGAGGGYMMGGGLGMGANDRKWGICIDQVLELEMVLATGEHVKFGPSEWEEVDGHLYPQTRAIKGVCNKNVHHLESEWEWGECDADIPFEDLWFAVRGGGGGTWGVLLSAWHQLHDDEPWYFWWPNVDASKALKAECEDAANCEDVTQRLNKVWTDFYIDFFYGDITEEMGNDESHSCGTNHNNFDDYFPTMFDTDYDLGYGPICIGTSAAAKVVSGWKKYVESNNAFLDGINLRLSQELFTMESPSVLMGGVPVTSFNEMSITLPAVGTMSPDTPEKPDFLRKAPAGRGFSIKTAGIYSRYGYNLIIPTSLLLEKSNMTYEILKTCAMDHTWGRNAVIASDGMDSMNPAFRKSFLGCQALPGELFASVQAAVIDQWKNDSEYEQGEFWGIQEPNHVQGSTPVPLKDDWKKVCPYNYSADERREKCMSVQETIWGTKNLAKLESIKEVVDPNNMFSVRYGVGNDWVMDGWHQKEAPASQATI